jgi:hypothetical protein
MSLLFGQVLMSILHLPNYKLYWSSSTLWKTSVPSIMKRSRFEKLTQYFHLNDTSAAPGRNDERADKLLHVRPYLTTLHQAFKTQYKLTREVAIDEAIVAFKGR